MDRKEIKFMVTVDSLDFMQIYFQQFLTDLSLIELHNK